MGDSLKYFATNDRLRAEEGLRWKWVLGKDVPGNSSSI